MRRFAIAFVVAASLSAAGCANVGPASCDRDYAAMSATEIEDIVAGEDVLRRIIRGGLAEGDASPEELAAIERMQAILDDRERPVDAIDLAILERAGEILARPEIWDRHDDRACGESDATYSLFCALQTASKEILGAYEHRRAALQEVRFAIEDARPGIEYEHRLMDFNNAPDTRFDDVKAVLAKAATRVRERLALQSRCGL